MEKVYSSGKTGLHIKVITKTIESMVSVDILIKTVKHSKVFGKTVYEMDKGLLQVKQVKYLKDDGQMDNLTESFN